MRAFKKKVIETLKENKQENYEKEPLVSIGCYLSCSLIDKLKNIVHSSKIGGDYTYVNYSNLVRKALIAHKNGMKLTSQIIKEAKKMTTFRVDNEIKKFYSRFGHNKSEIIERAILTYIHTEL